MTEHEDQILKRSHELAVTSHDVESVEKADKELATLIPVLIEMGFATSSGKSVYDTYLWCYTEKGIDRLMELNQLSDE